MCQALFSGHRGQVNNSPPWFCCSSVGMIALQSKNAPTTLTSRTRRNSSSLSSTTGTRSAPRAIAALLTRMSMRPNVSSVCCTIRLTSACWLISPTSASPRRPCASICSTVLCTSFQLTAFSSAGKVAGSRPVPVTTTSAPATAKVTAVARPMPRNVRPLSPWPLYHPELPQGSPLPGYVRGGDMCTSMVAGTMGREQAAAEDGGGSVEFDADNDY